MAENGSTDDLIRNPVEKDAGDASASPELSKWHDELSQVRDAAINDLLHGNKSPKLEEHMKPQEPSSGTLSSSLRDLMSNKEAAGDGQNSKKVPLPDSPGDLIKNELPTGSGTDKSQNNDRILGGLMNRLEKEGKEGVEALPTGDYLVREDGKETLFTPGGDKVTVNPDGTYAVKGDVSSVSTNKSGETTVKFADGAQVTFDKEGILSVQRGNQAVGFGRGGKNSSGNIEKHPFPGRTNPGDNSPQQHPYPPRTPDGSGKPGPRPDDNGDRQIPHPRQNGDKSQHKPSADKHPPVNSKADDWIKNLPVLELKKK